MKRIFVIALLIVAIPAYARAKEVSYEDVVSDPSKYADKPVVMKGSFLYSEPMRQSFTIDQGGNRIEVFYSELRNNDKELILAEPKFSKRAIVVSGTLKQYTNKARSFFINATSLRTEGGTAPAPTRVDAVSYADIQANPTFYANKRVTMKGSYLYSDPQRLSFTFDQSGTAVEVLVSDLSKSDRDLILSQKKYSKLPVTVSGMLLPYANSSKKYYINADSVRLDD